MKRVFVLLAVGCLFVLISLPSLVRIMAADDNAPRPYGLTKRIPWTTSRLIGTPEPPPPYKVARAFPKLTFKKPVYIAQEPGSKRLLVAELEGKIYAFDKDDANEKSKELFLDIKRQIYAFSFHPKYEKNNQVFVFSPQPKKSRVSRFVAKGNPKRCDPKTEKIIVEWPSGGHNGGEAIFGSDGYLYISTGDSTSTSDQNNTGQGVNDLLSVIMRIDVDRPAAGKPYSIPQDNPFVKFKGARPEIWAFGFRNPWRMSFDAKTGGLWVGDVGQDLWEMIWLVRRGGNYGWSVQEGTHPFHPGKKPGPGPILPPVVEHHHAECRSITGGYVYYGKKFPELRGVYFYGDYEYGKIWGLRRRSKRKSPPAKSKSPPTALGGSAKNHGHTVHDPNVVWHKELADTALRITSFGVSRDGDIYLVDHTSGGIYELARANVTKPKHPFPTKLSETGLFVSTKDHKTAPGVIAFTVNTPGWLDGATAERFLAMPGKTQIFVPANDVRAWKPDDGAVTAQTVYLEMEAGNPKSRRRIETRVMVQQENHWLGYSYLWNDAQTDATLAGALGRDVVLPIKDRSAANGIRRHTWHVPSRNECMFCHSRAAGFVLGLRTAQMNKDHDYGGIVDNQLRTYSHIGLFKKPLVEQSPHGFNRRAKKGKKPPADNRAGDYESFADANDANADLNGRARAYLHVNCSICHDGSGGGNSKFQVTYDKKITEANLLGAEPIHGSFGLTNARLIKPGDPYASVLYYRVSKLGLGRMPHIGSQVVDETALELFHDWIARLTKKGKVRSTRPPFAAYVSARKTLVKGASQSAMRRLLANTRGALMVSRLIAREKLSPAVRSKIVAMAVAHANPNVRDLFERFIPEEKRVRRLGEFVRAEEILALQGNAKRGREFFFTGDASQCRNCHRIGNDGGAFGPDLSTIGKKYKRHELLEALIEPSKKIDAKFRTHLLVTKSGKVLTGIVAQKTKTQVALNIFDAGQTKQLRFKTDEIVQLVPQGKSLMPDGLLRGLTPQQAADMVAFLASLK